MILNIKNPSSWCDDIERLTEIAQGRQHPSWLIWFPGALSTCLAFEFGKKIGSLPSAWNMRFSFLSTHVSLQPVSSWMRFGRQDQMRPQLLGNKPVAFVVSALLRWTASLQLGSSGKKNSQCENNNLFDIWKLTCCTRAPVAHPCSICGLSCALYYFTWQFFTPKMTCKNLNVYRLEQDEQENTFW